MDYDCVVCGEKKSWNDIGECKNCKAYLCVSCKKQPFANKNIWLCPSCWEKRDELLDKWR